MTGHSGDGILIVDRAEDVPTDYPMYVEYVPKKDEYRVHVFYHTCEDVQFLIQKKLRVRAEPNPNWEVRNLKGGFVYSSVPREDIPRIELEDTACEVLGALTLDFGAVDIVHNVHHNRLAVLEVNTAPGLRCERTFNFYKENLKHALSYL